MEWRNFSARNRQRRPAGFITPAEPTRAAHAPSGPEWVHEIKFDGFRIVAMKDNDRVRLWSRFGNDLTARFSAIRDAVAGLPVDRVLIDGEAVVLRGDGYCDFGALLERRASQQAVLVAFDLMQAGGEDLRPFPLAERRSRLERLLAQERSGVMLSQAIAGDGPTVFRHAEKLGLEGIVSKRVDKAYPRGRTKHWLKIKSAQYRR